MAGATAAVAESLWLVASFFFASLRPVGYARLYSQSRQLAAVYPKIAASDEAGSR